MDTFLELITALQDDLTIGSESTLYNETTIKRAINRAKWRAEGLVRWPETEDAKKTSTVTDQEYYDYPQAWRPDSVWKLEVDDEDYGNPLDFKDYLYEKSNDLPSGKERTWGNQWRRFFIYPIPTTDGDYNISIWGAKVIPALVNNSDTTIFSYSMPECNDAIITEAKAILKSKGNDLNASEFLDQGAKQVLLSAWARIKQERPREEKTTPFFNVPDFFARRGRGGSQNTGNF
jgi:hypothetical protein